MKLLEPGVYEVPSLDDMGTTVKKIGMTPIDVANLYLGKREVIGPKSDPAILAMLTLDTSWPTDDSVPWCAAFANWCCYHAGYERSKSLRARSFMNVGKRIWTLGDYANPLDVAEVGDVLVFRRGSGYSPGPDVVKAAGHVNFYAGRASGGGDSHLMGLGGNQGDTVSNKRYSTTKLLTVTRMEFMSGNKFV